MLLHHLVNFDIQKYDKNELKLTGAYSVNKSPNVKDGKFVINLAE